MVTSYLDRLKQFAKSKYGRDFRLAQAWGINRVTVSKYMNGDVKPSFDNLVKLSELGCDINWLLTGNGHKPEPGSDEVEEVLKKLQEMQKEILELKGDYEKERKVRGELLKRIEKLETKSN